MIDRRTIFEIHRRKHMGFSIRQIAIQLQLDRGTVSKYLHDPEYHNEPRKRRKSKLDPYRELIRELITQYPDVKSPVILQRIQEKGYSGEITIVRNYLKELRGGPSLHQPYTRFESEPGEQMQVDWGHFKSLYYGSTARKLYVLAVVEGHGRMLYAYFTHSQKQDVLHRGLVEAFKFFGGTPRDIVVDNMLTAVTERVGSIIRFNESFLDFLRPFQINPIACNIRSPHEKGKIEVAVRYIRQNFWPLRKFKDLSDVQRQVHHWLNTVANVRIHQTTGERPVDRSKPETLRKLPDPLPDYREIEIVNVHKDFGVRFDKNVYTVPPWAIKKKVTLKADNETVQIYYKEKSIAVHPRCWERYKLIELPSHKEQAKKLKKKASQDRRIAVFLSMGQVAADYLEALAGAGQPLSKTVSRLLTLGDQYGTKSLVYAVSRALQKNLYGADYIENILYQEMVPDAEYQPVVLKEKSLNDIRLLKPSLAEYDALILKRRNKNDR